MHGHGYAPQHQPPPSGGTHVTLRVVFAALAVVTCGMLAWTPMLRLAFVTRKAHDWLLFTLVTALDITALVLIGVDPGEDEFQGPGNAGMIVLLCTLTASLAYYLFADIRHFSPYRQQPPQPRFTGYVPQQQHQPPAPHQPGYGYPQQQAPTHYTAPPQTPTPPPPTRPAPARIHQVRAELDELSDYLRKQEGGS